MPESEKPWYLPILIAYIKCDVPELVGLTPLALERDINTLVKRVTAEGESFLTKTLPAFGKSIDYALQERAPLTTPLFKKLRRRSALPAFLQALTKRVFSDDGFVLAQPCIQSIICLRQITNWFKKVEKGFTDESLQKAVSTFIDVDRALPRVSVSTDPRLLGLAMGVVTLVFRGDHFKVSKLIPKHGPGAVAWGKGKYGLNVSYTDLERVFRPIPYFRSLGDVSHDPQELTSRPCTKYGLSRLAFVEKDSSGPRLIGLEPAEYMWCQQALKAWMYQVLEASPICGGQINFTDQNINRELTRNWLDWDTLDMSSASDRVSLDLVKLLFKRTEILPALLACRTPGVVLPDESALLYKKFAPMGSAVCFPVEAVVFYALAVAALHLAGVPFLIALKRTFVYGDDIIVPHGYFAALDRAFSSVGLKFSDQKCCISGKFRESCGLDAYDGVDVSPIRLRRPHCRKGELDFPSLVEHHNALFDRGFWHSAAKLRDLLTSRFKLARFVKSHPDKLPILTWRTLHYSTVKIFTKDSIQYVRGLRFIPQKSEADVSLEARFFRVSLGSKGSVGEFSDRRNPTQRFLVEKYRGTIKVRTVPLNRIDEGGAGAPPKGSACFITNALCTKGWLSSLATEGWLA